jgi:arylsulfatase A-like enzyme
MTLSMTKQYPNVLALTVDALRADRTSLYGYERSTSPNLKRLGEQSIVLDNAMTLAPFTQAACIQLFTSSRPLSHGGYDSGAFGRPQTLFERFRDEGYSTWGLSTIHWVSSYYGYTGGLETEHAVFHLNTLVGMAVVNMRDTLYYFRAGKIIEADMLKRVSPVIERMFDNIVAYATCMPENLPEYRRDFPASKIANDSYDFSKVIDAAETHRARFRADPAAYVAAELTGLTRAPDAHEWIAGDWYYGRTPGKLLSEFLFRAVNKALHTVDANAAHRRAASVRLAVDAHAIADKVISAMRHRDPARPFFIWAHFKDTHRPYVSGPGLRWYETTPKYLQALGYPDDLDPTLSVRKHYAENHSERETLSALYDAAVRSTDEAIGRIIHAAHDLGLMDDTVIGFSSDHGEEIGEHGDFGHECMAYEHNSRIPMLFKPAGANQGSRSDALVSSLDFSPTLTALAGIDAAPGWQGSNVTSETVMARNHIVTETFCRGNCLFEHRPLYMGVRTKTHKYLWQEAVDPHHKHGRPGLELYDLAIDPHEQNNLYHTGHPLVPVFNNWIADRLDEVPEINKARIHALRTLSTDAQQESMQ